eukprot:GSMAST32.ASY1.ANO1.63.1 assembled CDS
MTSPYNEDNVFAKILRGEIPCHKIFENNECLAFLDAFPSAKGHALLIPKEKVVDVSEMHEKSAARFLAQLPKLVRLVKAASGADAVNIISNCGADSGQVVFHCHFHVVPRWKGVETAFRHPQSSKTMITAEEANSVLQLMNKSQDECKRNPGMF